MNALIEKGIVNFLEAHLTGSPAPVILSGTGMDEVPNSLASVVVDVALKRHVGKLYYAAVKIRVTTPARVAGYDVTTHTVVVAAVRAELQDENAVALSPFVEASANFSVGGIYLEDVKDARDQNFWQTTFELNMACREL